MTSYIPQLARIVSSHGGKGRTARPSPAATARINVSQLAALAPLIRRRLGLGPAFSDEALLASLVAIARHVSHEARWHAAETSTLGQHLAASSRDRHRALVMLIALLPKPYL